MALAALSFALLTAVDTIFKLVVAGGHPTYQILLVNACFALLPVLIWSMATGGLGRLATARFPQHMARGATSVLSAFAAIYAYSRLPLTDFYAIVFAGPLVVTAMASFWLGESIEPARWWAIALGFIGILVVTNPLASPMLKAQGARIDPHQAAAALGRFAAFVSVFCYALSVIMIRRMRGRETNMSFSFYGYLTSILVGGSLCLACGVPALASGDIARLALSGTMGGIASIFMMTAYHRSPVALVAPFQYTQIIWGALAGFLIWQHVPSKHLLAGSAIVAFSGLYVIYSEMKAKEVRL
jgi:drug/metabolite transporter (DMT)-like permease